VAVGTGFVGVGFTGTTHAEYVMFRFCAVTLNGSHDMEHQTSTVTLSIVTDDVALVPQHGTGGLALTMAAENE
jgi:hypothetical protein